MAIQRHLHQGFGQPYYPITLFQIGVASGLMVVFLGWLANDWVCVASESQISISCGCGGINISNLGLGQ